MWGVPWAVIVLLAGLYVVGTGRSSREVDPGATRQPGPPEAPRQEDPQLVRVTPEVQVAAGEHRGARWGLRAQVVEFVTDEGPTKALCMNWRFGVGAGSGPSCGLSDGIDGGGENYFEVSIYQHTPDPSTVTFAGALGAVPGKTAKVELVSPEGTRTDARVVPAPEALGPYEFRFFVGFVRSDSIREVIAMDSSGNVLAREEIQPL